MASKSFTRSSQKDKSPKPNGKIQSDSLPDEIALRDEILELKRQMMVLKKTNEQNLVKFRKYEDEAKRKDRQIEQLMDPAKNIDVRKILSTKGAAILMNLKDQNNALIQIIVEKDLQIKRLLGEVKTSKLYASSRKTEPYRLEISRLRNLLIKSQELLKEATEVPLTRSICVGGTPVTEVTTSSSDQSSPRELEELRFTIQSLETHMKYSNELLGKKNQEIMILTGQLNSARNGFHCKECGKKSDTEPNYDYDLESTKYDWFQPIKKDSSKSESKDSDPGKPLTSGSDEVSEKSLDEASKSNKTRCSSADLLELFERTMMITRERKIHTKAPKSAPVGRARTLTKDVSPRRSSMPYNLDRSPDIIKANESPQEISGEDQTEADVKSISLGKESGTSEELERLISSAIISNKKRLRSKSLFHDIATGDIEESDERCGISLPDITCQEEDERKKDKERWREAVKKVRKSQRRRKQDVSCYRKEYVERPMILHKSSATNTRKKKPKSTDGKGKHPGGFSGNESELEALETYEFELMEKKIETDQVEIEHLIKANNPSDDIIEETEIEAISPVKTKLTRQMNILRSEDKVENEETLSDRPEQDAEKIVCSRPRKVVIAVDKEDTMLSRRLSLQVDSPKTKGNNDVAKGKSSVSVNGKTLPSQRSDSVPGKSLIPSPKIYASPQKKPEGSRTKKLQRSKDSTISTDLPVPLRRTKVGAAASEERLNEKEKSPKRGGRRHSTPNNFVIVKNVEVPLKSTICENDEKAENLAEPAATEPEGQTITPVNQDEITTYQIEQQAPATDTQQIKEEINNISARFSPEIQKELQNLYDNITSYEEVEKKKTKSLREVYRQSIDSSFDSENSCTAAQEAKTVEVEVEINAVHRQSSSSLSQEEIQSPCEENKTGGEDFFDHHGDNEDDDNDVIFR